MASDKPYPNPLSAQMESLTIQAPVGFLVVDAHGLICLANRLVESMFGYTQAELIGQPIEILIPQQYRAAHVKQRSDFMKAPSSRKMGSGRKLLGARKDGETFPVEVGLGYAHDQSEIFFSAVVVDISRQEQIEQEREQLVKELEAALSRVKQLSGLLPICASCKKIRDDKGYWTQIESYIRDHSEARFSHGICPVCAKTLYPELDLPPE